MINENLTPEEKREKYKLLKKYEISDNWKKIIKECKENGEKLLIKIKKELKEREVVELIHSELDKSNSYFKFYEIIIKKIDDSEGGKIFKEDIASDLEKLNTYIYGQVSVGYDAPVYSYLDLMKEERNFNNLLNKRLEEAITSYQEAKKEVVKEENVYKEATPEQTEAERLEFELLTNVN